MFLRFKLDWKWMEGSWIIYLSVLVEISVFPRWKAEKLSMDATDARSSLAWSLWFEARD